VSGPVVLTLTRDIAAPSERVFDAWLDPAIAARFLFATPGGAMLVCTIDARVGGRALIVEEREQGVAEHHLQFVEIDRPDRLVFLFRATMAGKGGEEGQWTRVALDFAATATGTHLTLTHRMDPEWASFEDQTRKGWTMILAQLARTLGDNA